MKPSGTVRSKRCSAIRRFKRSWSRAVESPGRQGRRLGAFRSQLLVRGDAQRHRSPTLLARTHLASRRHASGGAAARWPGQRDASADRRRGPIVEIRRATGPSIDAFVARGVLTSEAAQVLARRSREWKDDRRRRSAGLRGFRSHRLVGRIGRSRRSRVAAVSRGATATLDLAARLPPQRWHQRRVRRPGRACKQRGCESIISSSTAFPMHRHSTSSPRWPPTVVAASSERELRAGSGSRLPARVPGDPFGTLARDRRDARRSRRSGDRTPLEEPGWPEGHRHRRGHGLAGQPSPRESRRLRLSLRSNQCSSGSSGRNVAGRPR